MIKPYYEHAGVTLYHGNCLDVLPQLGAESVQCVVTSPPYWGLRKYSGEQGMVWGDVDCEHKWGQLLQRTHEGGGNSGVPIEWQRPSREAHTGGNSGQFCSLCGAWHGAHGLEPTPEMYVSHTIEFLRAIRRVLRKDGVVFWNIGDSYSGGDRKTNKAQTIGGSKPHDLPVEYSPSKDMGKHGTIKPKDLCLIPFRVAIAAQEDGWWVRSIIIWSKPNPMPESVTDRPTTSHEYILMLTKSKDYYWDQDAVREPQTGGTHSRGQELGNDSYQTARGSYYGWRSPSVEVPGGRNIRTVWEFPTQPYPEAHFAVFPEKLPELCIKAATSEKGNCPKCGKPWVRVVDYEARYDRREPAHAPKSEPSKVDSTGWNQPKRETLGWKPQCNCNEEPIPSLVLDPFCGTGTVNLVASKLGRRSIGIDTSEDYCRLAVERNRQGSLWLSQEVLF